MLEGDVELTRAVIGCAIEVHAALGPGLLESAYAFAMGIELEHRGMAARPQVAMELSYRGQVAPSGFVADLVVEDRVILELKAVSSVLPVHKAQLLTYLRVSGLRTGLLLNFNVPRLRDGIVRVVNPRATWTTAGTPPTTTL